jgi:hypothetical protein
MHDRVAAWFVAAKPQVVIPVPKASRSALRPVAAGIVQGTPGTGSFTIQTRGGASETIDVSSSSTTYCEHGVSSSWLANVRTSLLAAFLLSCSAPRPVGPSSSARS